MKKKLNFKQLSQGMVEVTENASQLLEEAKILQASEHHARAFMLAYSACEELGKISILLGAATRLSLQGDIDWRPFWARMRSHHSKAIQFLAVAGFLEMFKDKIDNRSESPKPSAEMAEGSARVGLIVSLLSTQLVEDALTDSKAKIILRSAGLYTDLYGDVFKGPSKVISSKQAQEAIDVADILIKGTDGVTFRSESALREFLKDGTSRWRRNFAFVDQLMLQSKRSGAATDEEWLNLFALVRDETLGNRQPSGDGLSNKKSKKAATVNGT